MRRLAVLAVTIVIGVTAFAGASDAKKPSAPPPKCDPIDTTQCLLPFPNDFFTVADATSPTGRRLHFDAATLPKNINGKAVDPTDLNRNDGFSPGSTIMVRVPSINLQRTGIAPLTNIGASLSPGAPVVLLDAATGKRVPYWAELDTWNPNPATKALVIRPARNFLESHRIVVALRDLRDAKGKTIAAPKGFRTLREGHHADDALEVRRPAMNRLFADLEFAGVPTDDLYLAWDFTVGSEQGLAGAMLHMRDDAYAQLGSGVPGFTVTNVDQNPNANVARRVRGTFDVPMYLSGSGEPGSRFVRGADGLPQRTGTFKAQFRCLIPNSAVTAPGRGVVYGHGLLGDTDEIEGHAQFINQYDMVLCATPEIGMAEEDVPNVLNVISDFSTFSSIPERLQQGMLNMQWLARLLKDPRGFGANAAFQVGAPLHSSIKPNEVYFNGNSQGGIFGGAATAISKEWTRAVLGVPGMNYSTLLPRSVDFDIFLPLLSAFYTDPTTHTLLVAAGQVMWDHGEPNGYAQHMIRDSYPDTPAHDVLLIEAFGDHQVANISTETMARTIGASVNQPALAPGRSRDVTPMWDIPPVPTSPYKGSVLEIWDFGTPAPPVESIPPRPPEFGDDPHGAARNVAAVRQQVSDFLQPDGAFIDVCGASPCKP